MLDEAIDLNKQYLPNSASSRWAQIIQPLGALFVVIVGSRWHRRTRRRIAECTAPRSSFREQRLLHLSNTIHCDTLARGPSARRRLSSVHRERWASNGCTCFLRGVRSHSARSSRTRRDRTVRAMTRSSSGVWARCIRRETRGMRRGRERSETAPRGWLVGECGFGLKISADVDAGRARPH